MGAVSYRPGDEPRDNRYVSVVSRLKQGVTLCASAGADGHINQRLAQTYVETNSGWGVRLINLRERLVGAIAPIAVRFARRCGVRVADRLRKRREPFLRSATVRQKR